MLEIKYQALKDMLRGMGRVVVAFSGGVDSTLLLKVAKDVLGNDLLAVTAVSETMPQDERKAVMHLADVLNVAHLCVQSREMELEGFVKNPPDRCYLCKKCRFADLLTLAAERNFLYVVDGENRDDQEDYRPGILAARELNIRSPLSEAGFTKSDIRHLSKKLDLPTWNKPSDACLASRIPYHRRITMAKLRQIDAGEAFIRKLGLSGPVRVRHCDDTARIEVEPKAFQKLNNGAARNAMVTFFKAIGFDHVVLDLEGYRTGSLNMALPSIKEKEIDGS